MRLFTCACPKLFALYIDVTYYTYECVHVQYTHVPLGYMYWCNAFTRTHIHAVCCQQDECQEFKILCGFLELSPNITTSMSSSSAHSSTGALNTPFDGDIQLSPASCVRWLCDAPAQQLTTWCQQLLPFTERSHHTAKVSSRPACVFRWLLAPAIGTSTSI